jgi:phosphoglycolate phosphatase
MKRSKIQALVFDWDGTIIDSTRLIVDSLLAAGRDLGFSEPSRPQASSLIGLVLTEAARRLHPTINEAQLAQFVERYRHYYFQKDASLQPFIGIPELLDELAGQPVWLAVATGKSRMGLMRALTELGWLDGANKRFISLRCGDDGEPKPSPWMLNDLGEELGLKPDEMIMIGDTTHDLGMARSAQVEAVAVNYGAQPVEALERFIATAQPEHAAVHMVSSVAQLRDRLLSYLQ